MSRPCTISQQYFDSSVGFFSPPGYNKSVEGFWVLYIWDCVLFQIFSHFSDGCLISFSNTYIYISNIWLSVSLYCSDILNLIVCLSSKQTLCFMRKRIFLIWFWEHFWSDLEAFSRSVPIPLLHLSTLDMNTAQCVVAHRWILKYRINTVI